MHIDQTVSGKIDQKHKYKSAEKCRDGACNALPFCGAVLGSTQRQASVKFSWAMGDEYAFFIKTLANMYLL